jgi:hypothetical protein
MNDQKPVTDTYVTFGICDDCGTHDQVEITEVTEDNEKTQTDSKCFNCLNH